MPRRKGVELVPSWWFALRPGMSPGFGVRVSRECKRRGVAKSDRSGVLKVANELTPNSNRVLFNMLHIIMEEF